MARAAVALGLVGLGLLLGRALGSGSDDRPAQAPSPVVLASPLRPSPGAPDYGTTRTPRPTRGGAVAAATRMLTRLSDPALLRAPGRSGLVAREVALPAARPALAARLEAGFRLIARNLGAAEPVPLLFRLVPLGYRLEAYDGRQARVALWQVVLVAKASGPAASATWSTSRLTLRWTPRGWRLQSFAPDTTGPTPSANLPAQATPASAFLADAPAFARYAR